MLEVSKRLVQKGIKVSVVLTRYDKKLTNNYPGIKFIEIGGPATGEYLFWLTLPLFFFRLKRILDKIPDKILFPQIFPPVWWAAIYKMVSPQTKVVWMCQEPSAFIHSPLVIRSLKQPGKFIAVILNPILKRVDNFLVKKVDYIIANSLYGQSLVKSTYGREADIYAYPSVDPKTYKPESQKENYLFTVSRLDKQKNIEIILRALALLKLKISHQYKLFIGGDGTEKENLEKVTRELGIENRVVFLGYVNEGDLPKLYARAKIALFLGEFEPFGIIPVEAMACGTPVIGLSGGGVVESIVNGETGLLLKSKNPKELAQVLDNLLADEKLLKRMSVNARKRVLTNFSWDKTTEKIETFLRLKFKDEN